MSDQSERAWRHDAVLVAIPSTLLLAAAVAWVFQISLDVALAAGAVVAGAVLLAGLFRAPPTGSRDD